MTQEELHRLARLGAETRLGELEREIQSIHGAFPELRRGAPAQPSTTRLAKNGSATEPAVRKRRRRKMSAEARRRIGEAQRKRWAEWKAQQGGEGNEAAQAAGVGRSRKRK